MKKLHGLQQVGVYALIAGGVVFLGEMVMPQLQPYAKWGKLLIIGGAAIFVLGWVMKAL